MKNRGFFQGLGLGVLLTVLAVSVTATALAAGRTISIDDGVKVTVNGSAFQPKDAKGNQVPVFSYNGTVYVPMRALSDALGFAVSYESASRTAAVSGSAGGNANSNSYIGQDRAKALALAHAGLKESAVTFVTAELDQDDGRAVYDVEFYTGTKEYDYEIDALTGTVLKYDYDADGYAPSGNQTAYIGQSKAEAIALKKAPTATVISCKLDTDDGKARYELELRDGSREYDCEINAVTGDILKWELD